MEDLWLQTFGPSSWENVDGWEEGGNDISEYYGVTISIEGKLIRIKLNNNNVKGGGSAQPAPLCAPPRWWPKGMWSALGSALIPPPPLPPHAARGRPPRVNRAAHRAHDSEPVNELYRGTATSFSYGHGIVEQARPLAKSLLGRDSGGPRQNVSGEPTCLVLACSSPQLDTSGVCDGTCVRRISLCVRCVACSVRTLPELYTSPARSISPFVLVLGLPQLHTSTCVRRISLCVHCVACSVAACRNCTRAVSAAPHAAVDQPQLPSQPLPSHHHPSQGQTCGSWCCRTTSSRARYPRSCVTSPTCCIVTSRETIWKGRCLSSSDTWTG